MIRTIAVDLVRGHVDERRFRAGPPRRFEQVQRADGVDVEVVERDRRRAIVGRLRGGMDDGVRAVSAATSSRIAGAIANVELVMREARSASRCSRCWFQRVSPCGTEEHGALIVVDAVHLEAIGGKVGADLGTDQTGRAGDKNSTHL